MKTRLFGFTLIGLLLACLCVYLFSPRFVRTFSEGNIEGGIVKRRFLSLSVHSGEVHYLKCGKNVYLNVRGLEPFHLKVPGTESILFVTERLNGSVVFHFLNTNTLSEIEVSGDRSNFGSDIGGSPPSGDYRNFVDRVSANEIVLGTRSPEFTKLTFIDLKLKRVERVESEVIDRTEKVQRHLY